MATRPQACSVAWGYCDPSAAPALCLTRLALAPQSSLSNPSTELFYPSADDTPAQYFVSCKLTQDVLDFLIQITNKVIKKAYSWSSAKGNANSCNLGTNNPMHCYRLGSNCLGKSSAEKDTKLKVNQQCTLSARRPSASWGVSVGVRNLKKVVLPIWHPWDKIQRVVSPFVFLRTRQRWI